MKILSIIGHSGIGKTHLIKRLVSELKSRGHSVAVIKHCHHGFSLSPDGKDSWQFVEAGADAVSVIGPDRIALERKSEADLDYRAIAARYFEHIDIVLVEGGRKDQTLGKIEVLRKGVAEKVSCPQRELLAVISDFESNVGKPVYHPDQIDQIADFVERHIEEPGSRLVLYINGSPIRMKSFVQNMFVNVVYGLLASLQGFEKMPQRITLSIRGKDPEGGGD